MNGSPQPLDPPPDAAGTRKRSRALLIGVLLGSVAGLIGVLVVMLLAARDPIPLLTRGEYEDAVKRWETRGPKDYDQELVLAGSQAGRIRVEVRGGEVTRMTRNGVVPSQKRSWDYWSVPGQLEIIGEDLDRARSKDPDTSGMTPERLVLRARFDPQLGYPVRYERADLDTQTDTQWVVTQFAIREPSNPPER